MGGKRMGRGGRGWVVVVVEAAEAAADQGAG